MDQGSTMKRSAVHNFAPTVTKFCVMWEGQALPHDTKFGNSRCEIVGRRVIFIWSLIHGLRWSGLIKAGPGLLDLHIAVESLNPLLTIWSYLIATRQLGIYMEHISTALPSFDLFNSSWHIDATRCHRSGSTLTQVMACCLTTPSHYLTECWLIVSKVRNP